MKTSIVLAALLVTAAARAATFTVTTTADSGGGTLRQAGRFKLVTEREQFTPRRFRLFEQRSQ